MEPTVGASAGVSKAFDKLIREVDVREKLLLNGALLALKITTESLLALPEMKEKDVSNLLQGTLDENKKGMSKELVATIKKTVLPKIQQGILSVQKTKNAGLARQIQECFAQATRPLSLDYEAEIQIATLENLAEGKYASEHPIGQEFLDKIGPDLLDQIKESKGWKKEISKQARVIIETLKEGQFELKTIINVMNPNRT